MVAGLILVLFAAGAFDAKGSSGSGSQNGGGGDDDSEPAFFESSAEAFNYYSRNHEASDEVLGGLIAGIGGIAAPAAPTADTFSINAALVKLTPKAPFYYKYKALRIGIPTSADSPSAAALSVPIHFAPGGAVVDSKGVKHSLVSSPSHPIITPPPSGGGGGAAHPYAVLGVDYKQQQPDATHTFICNGGTCEMSASAGASLGYCGTVGAAVGEYAPSDNSGPPYQVCNYGDPCGYCYEYKYRRCLGVLLIPAEDGGSTQKAKRWNVLVTGRNQSTNTVGKYGRFLEDLCYAEGPASDAGAWTLFPPSGSYEERSDNSDTSPCGAACSGPPVAPGGGGNTVSKSGAYLTVIVAMADSLFVSAVNAFGEDLRDDPSNRPPQPDPTLAPPATTAAAAPSYDASSSAVDAVGLRIGGIALLAAGVVLAIFGAVFMAVTIRLASAAADPGEGGAGGDIELGGDLPKEDAAAGDGMVMGWHRPAPATAAPGVSGAAAAAPSTVADDGSYPSLYGLPPPPSLPCVPLHSPASSPAAPGSESNGMRIAWGR